MFACSPYLRMRQIPWHETNTIRLVTATAASPVLGQAAIRDDQLHGRLVLRLRDGFEHVEFCRAGSGPQPSEHAGQSTHNRNDDQLRDR